MDKNDKERFDMIVERTFDSGKYMVQVNDHHTKKVHILEHTYGSIFEAQRAGLLYMTDLQKEADG